MHFPSLKKLISVREGNLACKVTAPLDEISSPIMPLDSRELEATGGAGQVIAYKTMTGGESVKNHFSIVEKVTSQWRWCESVCVDCRKVVLVGENDLMQRSQCLAPSMGI
jgi:hypothetical protein